MKVCTQTHHVPGFGEVPAGSLWEDDSPYVVDADCFAEVDAPQPVPVKRAPLRKPGKPAPAPLED